jgi:hypothetical protein
MLTNIDVVFTFRYTIGIRNDNAVLSFFKRGTEVSWPLTNHMSLRPFHCEILNFWGPEGEV